MDPRIKDAIAACVAHVRRRIVYPDGSFYPPGFVKDFETTAACLGCDARLADFFEVLAIMDEQGDLDSLALPQALELWSEIG